MTFKEKITNKLNEIFNNWEETPNVLKKQIKTEIVVCVALIVVINIAFLFLKIGPILPYIDIFFVVIVGYFLFSKFSVCVNNNYEVVIGKVKSVAPETIATKVANALLGKDKVAVKIIVDEKEKTIKVPKTVAPKLNLNEEYKFYFGKSFDFKTGKKKVDYQNLIIYEELEEKENEEDRERDEDREK